MVIENEKRGEYLQAAGVDGVVNEDEAGDFPHVADVALDELVGATRVPALEEDEAERPPVRLDVPAERDAELAQVGVRGPVADGHRVVPRGDRGEEAGGLEEVRDARRGLLDAAALAERRAHGLEEGVGARRTVLEVPAVVEGRPPRPLARDVEAAAAQHARYLRDESGVVANLGSAPS